VSEVSEVSLKTLEIVLKECGLLVRKQRLFIPPAIACPQRFATGTTNDWDANQEKPDTLLVNAAR
jgi:hypothetical protein